MANQDPLGRPPLSLSADTLRRLTAVARAAALGAFGVTPPPTDSTRDEIRRRIAATENRLQKTREAAARAEADRRTLARVLVLLDRATALASRGWSESRVAAGLALEMAHSHVDASLEDTTRQLEELREAVRTLETSAENNLAAQSVAGTGSRPSRRSVRTGAGVVDGRFERRGNVLRYIVKISGKVPPVSTDKGGETKNK